MKLTTEQLHAFLRGANPACDEPPDGAPLDDAGRNLLSRIMAEPTIVVVGQSARRRGALVVLALLVGGGIGAGATTLASAGTPGEADGGSPATAAELSSVSTPGSPITVVGGGPRIPSPNGAEASLLATRGDLVFFRLGAAGAGCFGESVGEPVRSNTYRVDLLECGGRFPSVKNPVLDQSVMQSTRGEAGVRVVRIEGFAADGVATVAATDEHGSVLAETAVSDNVYRLTAYPTASVARLVARDPSGRVVYSHSFG